MSKSVFKELGFKKVLEGRKEEIKTLYCSDSIPWVVGYSGGKDSTAVLQLVWLAISELPKEKRTKNIYVISTDTLVENPVVAAWVRNSLKNVDTAAFEQDLPIEGRLLTPETTNTFWVNLIGRGYPAPRHKFRWCTERMKIKPADKFIRTVVQESGEAIVLLGTRSAESTVRAARIKQLKENIIRDNLFPHSTLPNAYVFAPIEDWSNDDVWMFLMQEKNPWGHNNKDLLTMYKGATSDNECPLVIDTKTPSCGDSRFGCWVCTLVEKDKSMAAMIQNDSEKAWMYPLLKFRNELDFRNNENLDYDKRDFRRMHGQVSLVYETERVVPGPYTQDARAEWLQKLLLAERTAKAVPEAPPEVKDLELITLPELHEIRRIWVVEKHETEDLLPKIYKEVTGKDFPGEPIQDNQPFSHEELGILRDVCGEQSLLFEMLRELLDVERSFRTKAIRTSLFKRIEKAFEKSFYDNVDDAKQMAIRKRDRRKEVNELEEADENFIKVLQKVKTKIKEETPTLIGSK